MASDVVAMTVPLTSVTATTPGVDATDFAPFDLPSDDCATCGNVTRGQKAWQERRPHAPLPGSQFPHSRRVVARSRRPPGWCAAGGAAARGHGAAR
eukprot:3648427-Prymnesium_polylepis.1